MESDERPAGERVGGEAPCAHPPPPGPGSGAPEDPLEKAEVERAGSRTWPGKGTARGAGAGAEGRDF